jgi:ComF family protein
MNGRLMGLFGSNLLSSARDLLFPKKCFGCGWEGEWLCQQCLKKNQSRPGIFCPVCRRLISENCCCPRNNCKWLGSLADYQDPFVSEMIRGIKYNGITELVGSFWRSRLESYWQKFGDRYTCNSILVPLPLHRQKLLSRGFNQSFVLCETLAEVTGLSIADDLIVRTINNKAQAGSDFLARQKNVQGIFKADYRALSKYWDREVVLVDDVYTTGATMNECAKELAKKGFRGVSAIVLAINR